MVHLYILSFTQFRSNPSLLIIIPFKAHVLQWSGRNGTVGISSRWSTRYTISTTSFHSPAFPSALEVPKEVDSLHNLSRREVSHSLSSSSLDFPAPLTEEASISRRHREYIRVWHVTEEEEARTILASSRRAGPFWPDTTKGVWVTAGAVSSTHDEKIGTSFTARLQHVRFFVCDHCSVY